MKINRRGFFAALFAPLAVRAIPKKEIVGEYFYLGCLAPGRVVQCGSIYFLDENSEDALTRTTKEYMAAQEEMHRELVECSINPPFIYRLGDKD